ncbi:MAG: hypothetical protein ABI130_09405 [Leifsonia sp.]
MTNSSAPSELDVVRIKLGPDRAAPQPDPLGRERIGYKPGLTVNELWERGRGVWKVKLPNVAAADLLVLVADGVVVGVGSIDGVAFVGDRVAISGRPDPQHPLIGQPDPVPNASRNPPAYGRVLTVPASKTEQRTFQAIQDEATRILTEAARLRSPRLQALPSGGWGSHPTETDPADWAELVTLALAGAAANVGGIETALAGRPGSWEAAGIRSLLESTVGEDESALWEHRTEPVRITVDLDEILADAYWQYDEAFQEINRRRDAAAAAEPAIDTEKYVWVYDVPDDGDPVPHSPEAPAWSWDAWREANRASGVDQEFIATVEKHIRDHVDLITTALHVPKSPEAAADLDRLDAAREARLAVYDELEEQLDQQHVTECSAYAETLTKRLRTQAARIPGLTVPIEIRIDPADSPDDGPTAANDDLEQQLLDAAILDTPSPAELPDTPLERLERSQPGR